METGPEIFDIKQWIHLLFTLLNGSATRIQCIPQAVTEEIDAQNRQDDEQAGEEPQPGSRFNVLIGPIQHIAPRSSWRLHTQAQETDIRLCQDGICDAECSRHHNGGDTVW